MTRTELIEVEPTRPGGALPEEALLELVVMGPDGIIQVALPPTGTLMVGRSRVSDVQLADDQASRRHASLQLGAVITVEDLGSRNGTLVLRGATSPQRRVGDESYLRARLDEECARARRQEAPFALLAVRFLDGKIAKGLEILSALLRPSDTLVKLELRDTACALLPGPRPGEAAASLDRTVQQLKERGLRFRPALVCHPTDGNDAAALLERLERAVSVEPRRAEPAGERTQSVQAPEMKAIHAALVRIAPGSISVLILGETGVGKDVLAEQIHRMSPRASGPFLRLNCGALTESLLESELFGHERGAFTGAWQSKPGLLESAQGGTVFLDEIGELPLHLQVKLLQVLETREVLRVGGVRPRAIDVRFLSATNRDLHEEVRRGRFRQDLLFRLEGFAVRVPPLRQRTEEILPLAHTFVAFAARELGRPAPEISPEAERELLALPWPGNIRQLRNTIERAVLLCGGRIEPSHLGRPHDAESRHPATPDPDDEEHRRILAALEQCAGNQTRAAKQLGVARSTLVLRLERYGIARPRR